MGHPQTTKELAAQCREWVAAIVAEAHGEPSMVEPLAVHIQSAAQDIQTHEEADVRVASCGGFRHFLCIKCQNYTYPTLRLGGDNIKLATHRLPAGGRGTCVATWVWRNRSHAIMPLALLHRVQVVIVRPTFRLCTCETTVRIRRNAEKGESE